METVYFDNSATTPLCAEAKAAMTAEMEIYGNPSSLHSLGVEAEKTVSEARRAILTALGVRCVSKLDENQLVFTASGTEADNLALIGSMSAKNFTPGKKVIISDSEHPAIMETAKALERRGFNVVRIPTPHGVPDYTLLAREADRDTVLASFMLVNNETGAIYDIHKISEIVKAANPSCIVHTDCVQGFLKIPFTVKSLGADMITVSSHKVNGPKGVGALYISPEIIRSKKISPVIFGGGQERGLRSGTENTIGIAGFGASVKVNSAKLADNIALDGKIRARLVEALSGADFPGVKLNLPENAAPHILSITLPAIRSEVMLHSLSHAGIFVSSGSACSSNTGHGSYVLAAYGLTDREADCTIRVSLGAQNTPEEAEKFLAELKSSLGALARMS